jgi:hypothetical protein
MDIPRWPGWHLVGRFPDEEDGVGSWLLHHNGEAMLLELPPGLTTPVVKRSLKELGVKLRHATASHEHEDHFDEKMWYRLNRHIRGIKFHRPQSLRPHREVYLDLGGEPLWLLHAPKHSAHDTIVVFRGVAMTGDIELGTEDSVNDEVSQVAKCQSMDWFRKFPQRRKYNVHSTVSAHLNDVRTDIDWNDLFTCHRGVFA